MGKSCCAVGYINRLKKGSGIQFYRFPEDKVRRWRWVAAVRCKNWNPMQYSWICSAHFVSGSKSNDPLFQIMFLPFLTMSRFLTKKRARDELDKFRRRSEANRRRLSHSERQEAAEGLLEFGNGVTYCEPHSGTFTLSYLWLKSMRSFWRRRNWI